MGVAAYSKGERFVPCELVVGPLFMVVFCKHLDLRGQIRTLTADILYLTEKAI